MSIYLSASSIADFIKCSKMVEYRIKKPFPEVKSREMILGTIMHSVIEKGWEDRDKALELLQTECDVHKLPK